MEHYVLMEEWAFDGDSEFKLIGVYHSKEDLKAAFETKRFEELDFADTCDLTIEMDTSTCFQAFEEGNYNERHVNLIVLTSEEA